jgi:hypothetical protein
MLGLAALAWPLVLFLVVYDVRWIALALRAGQRPPWGAFLRLAAAAFCHGGALLLALHAHDWTSRQLTFWLHMTLDPGLTFYAFGLWELFGRVQQRPAA